MDGSIRDYEKAYAGICAHVGSISLILGSSSLMRGGAIS